MINRLPTNDLARQFSIPEELFEKIAVVKERPMYFWTLNDQYPSQATICCALKRSDLYTDQVADYKKIYTHPQYIFKTKDQTLVLKEFRNVFKEEDVLFTAILLDNVRCVIDD